MGRAQMERPRRISRSYQLAFDNTLRLTRGRKKMIRYNKFKLRHPEGPGRIVQVCKILNKLTNFWRTRTAGGYSIYSQRDHGLAQSQISDSLS